MSQIIKIVQSGGRLSDEQFALLEAVRKDPRHPEFPTLWLAGLI